MSEYEITAPDGRQFIVNAPEGASQEQILAYVKDNLPAPPIPSMPEVVGQAVLKGAASIPDAVLNAPANVLNLGKAAVGATAGAMGRPDIAANMGLTQPPSPVRSGLEAVGAISPDREPQTPAQRVVDMAIQAATQAAVIPAQGVAGVARNVGTLAVSGAAAGVTKEVTGSDLLALAVGVLTPAALGLAGNLGSKKPIGTSTQKATLKEAQAAGYVVEPSSVRQPSSKLETVAGKASIAQEAALRNQEVTNNLAAKSIGLPENTPLTPGLLDELKKKVAKPYEDVEALRASKTEMEWFPRYHSKSLLDELRAAQQESKALWKSYFAKPDIGVQKAAKASDALAVSLEKDIERVAVAAGKPELLDQLKAARQLYARINDVEKALNIADGNISAPIIGRMLDKGIPLGGELRIIGKFQQAFPRVAREVASTPPSGVSGTDAASSALLGTVGYGAAGGPAGLVAAGLPLARGPARQAVLSKMYQKRLLREPGAAPTLAQQAQRGVMAGKAVAQTQEQP